MSEKPHPLVGFTSYAIPVRITQCVLAVVGLGLAAYAVSRKVGWTEAIVILAAVNTLYYQAKI